MRISECDRDNIVDGLDAWLSGITQDVPAWETICELRSHWAALQNGPWELEPTESDNPWLDRHGRNDVCRALKLAPELTERIDCMSGEGWKITSVKESDSLVSSKESGSSESGSNSQSNIYTVKDEFYLTDIFIYVGPWESFASWFKAKFDEELDDWSECRGVCYRNGETHIVWMPDYDHMDPYHVATLAHEIMHISVYEVTSFNDDYLIGVHNDEHLTYHHSYLMRRILEAMLWV